MLALLFFGTGCQPSQTSSHNVNDFTRHWIASVTRANASQLNGCLSPAASPEAVALTKYAQQAKRQRIDIRFDASKAVIEKGAPRDYQVALPFVLSGPVGLHQKGTLTLSVQEDVFGAYQISDASGDLRFHLTAAQNKVAQSQHRETKMKRIATPRDTILARATQVRQTLAHPKDEIVYYTQVDTALLFYVARGDWDYSALYDDAATTSCLMGVVNGRGDEIIPVAFDKIYNPGGTLPGLIEVERGGKRGFYNGQGQPVISVSFEAVYPYPEDEQVVAQVRFDGRYGWLDWQGNLHLDADSHPDRALFESPAASDRWLQWKYDIHKPGLSYLRLPSQNNEHNLYGAIIISPSHLHDLGRGRRVHDQYPY